MVSRRSTQSVTQRSTRQSELHMTRRPRRLVAPKTVDDAVGLSRKEERELKKALYASLQESRRPRTPQLEEESSTSEETPKLRKSTRTIVSPLSYPAGVKDRSNASSATMDESSQDSVMSSVSSSHDSKKKVHAQRKFAQGCSLPSTPGNTPNKKGGNSPHSLLDRVPKTEDFLTFLCLRGSHLLPANLDFFNFARDESSLEEGSSRPRTPVTAEPGEQKEQTRESTPESSSSGSNMNEELMEITTPISTPSRLLQATRKAARASAGTPETARGIISLRQGLTRKVVHSGATLPSQHSRKYLYTPEKTPSPSGSRLAFGEFTPAKKSASVKCLPASFLRFSPAGKLALERNGNSPGLTPYKTPAAPSPLGSSRVKDRHYQGQGQRQEFRKSVAQKPILCKSENTLTKLSGRSYRNAEDVGSKYQEKTATEHPHFAATRELTDAQSFIKLGRASDECCRNKCKKTDYGRSETEQNTSQFETTMKKIETKRQRVESVDDLRSQVCSLTKNIFHEQMATAPEVCLKCATGQGCGKQENDDLQAEDGFKMPLKRREVLQTWESDRQAPVEKHIPLRRSSAPSCSSASPTLFDGSEHNVCLSSGSLNVKHHHKDSSCTDDCSHLILLEPCLNHGKKPSDINGNAASISASRPCCSISTPCQLSHGFRQSLRFSDMTRRDLKKPLATCRRETNSLSSVTAPRTSVYNKAGPVSSISHVEKAASSTHDGYLLMYNKPTLQDLSKCPTVSPCGGPGHTCDSLWCDKRAAPMEESQMCCHNSILNRRGPLDTSAQHTARRLSEHVNSSHTTTDNFARGSAFTNIKHRDTLNCVLTLKRDISPSEAECERSTPSGSDCFLATSDLDLTSACCSENTQVLGADEADSRVSSVYDVKEESEIRKVGGTGNYSHVISAPGDVKTANGDSGKAGRECGNNFVSWKLFPNETSMRQTRYAHGGRKLTFQTEFLSFLRNSSSGFSEVLDHSQEDEGCNSMSCSSTVEGLTSVPVPSAPARTETLSRKSPELLCTQQSVLYLGTQCGSASSPLSGMPSMAKQCQPCLPLTKSYSVAADKSIINSTMFRSHPTSFPPILLQGSASAQERGKDCVDVYHPKLDSSVLKGRSATDIVVESNTSTRTSKCGWKHAPVITAMGLDVDDADSLTIISKSDSEPARWNEIPENETSSVMLRCPAPPNLTDMGQMGLGVVTSSGPIVYTSSSEVLAMLHTTHFSNPQLSAAGSHCICVTSPLSHPAQYHQGMLACMCSHCPLDVVRASCDRHSESQIYLDGLMSGSPLSWMNIENDEQICKTPRSFHSTREGQSSSHPEEDQSSLETRSESVTDEVSLATADSEIDESLLKEKAGVPFQDIDMSVTASETSQAAGPQPVRDANSTNFTAQEEEKLKVCARNQPHSSLAFVSELTKTDTHISSLYSGCSSQASSSTLSAVLHSESVHSSIMRDWEYIGRISSVSNGLYGKIGQSGSLASSSASKSRGVASLGRKPCLYPLPPTLCSVPSFFSFSPREKVPTGTFKPVEPAMSRIRRESRSSNPSPVRRVLEGASKKLIKSQSADSRRSSHKRDTLRDRSREDRARNRSRPLSVRNQRAKKRRTEVRRSVKNSATTAPKVKPKRRSSMRLKTLAKILGRKRPNYSLVLSGYADMEEYEEEQKKKAAKQALAKAKAEARAKASAKQAAGKTKEPERMTTRSSSTTAKEGEVSKDDSDRAGTGPGKRLSLGFLSREVDEKRGLERERAGAGMARRSSTSSANRDGEDRRPGEGLRTAGTGVALKRSPSNSSMVKKEQPALAAIIETKRVKREGGRDAEGGGREEAAGRSRHSSTRESGRRMTIASATPHSSRKVIPKKPTPERASSSSTPSSPEPGLSDLEKVPTFHPTEEEFSDPITYIEGIREKAEPFGMCHIVPPASWRMESKVNEEIRFTTQIQHLHRLFNRWGSSIEQTRAIVHHLRDIMNTPQSSTPQIGGVEVDLPQLYRMIRDLGGLQNIVDKKQWVKVADAMKIPKAAHDRVTRLYDVYCKFVLPFAMLSEAEKEQAQKDVHRQYELSSAEEDAILKGKSMTLGTFGRIARNVQSMWFREPPTPEMVEAAYWKIVEECKTHVSVQCAHVNTRTQSTAFPMRRESPYFRHSWNLNNLPENKKCILKCLGPVSGATIPTLHVGMLFSTSCWSTDPHRLPYVQYLHSGANTIWYCIPKTHGQKLHDAMNDLCPTLIHNDPLWLSEDVAMVKPYALKEKGVQVARCVQQPRQFVVVFPDVYTATVCCGYNVSESVHYATTEWLSVSMEAAKALCSSGEKELFSVDTLVCGLCQDSTDLDTLSAALPLLQQIVAGEIEERRQLSAAGLKCERRLAVEDSPGTSASIARKRSHDLAEDSACEVCYRICYLSMVLNEHDEQILCLEHGLKHVLRKRHVKAAKLFYRYTEEELTELVQTTKDRVASLTAAANNASGSKKRTLKKQDSKS